MTKEQMIVIIKMYERMKHNNMLITEMLYDVIDVLKRELGDDVFKKGEKDE